MNKPPEALGAILTGVQSGTARRPDYCPGAVLVDPGGGKRHRLRCNGEVEVVEKVNRLGQRWTVTMGLCASCSERERENRLELAAKPEETGPRYGRKFEAPR